MESRLRGKCPVKIEIGPCEDDRKIDIHLDPWDTWSLDYTLALIIAPALRQLKDATHGASLVDNEDVPEELHAPEDHGDDVDEHHFARWDWVLDEMIWAFERIAADNDWDDAREVDEVRETNALRLFGKYYRGLWD